MFPVSQVCRFPLYAEPTNSLAIQIKNNKYKSIVLGFPKIIELKVDDNALTLSGCILDSENHSFVN